MAYLEICYLSYAAMRRGSLTIQIFNRDMESNEKGQGKTSAEVEGSIRRGS